MGRKKHYYKFKGELKTIKEIATITQMSISTVRNRINHGVPFEHSVQKYNDKIKRNTVVHEVVR